MMLERAKRLLAPSARSAVPAFMVMDVMAAAARIEAAGGHVVHMEVGQPAASAPASAIAAARAALAVGRLGFTPQGGVPSQCHNSMAQVTSMSQVTVPRHCPSLASQARAT